MDTGLRYEIWTPANSGNFKRKADITPWVLIGTALDLRFVDLSAGTLIVHQDCPVLGQILTVDRADHTNDVASALMVFRGTTLVAAMVPTRRKVSVNEAEPWVTYHVDGLEWYLDKSRVKAFDNPADPIREGDWLYGAPTVLTAAGGEISDAQWFMWMEGATTGNYAITDGTDTTNDIAYSESNPATIATRLETDITAITSVLVSGAGTAANKFLIILTDPAETDLTLTEAAPVGGAHDGTLTIDQTRVGGSLSPRPWHGSIDGNTGVIIGNYQQFDMIGVSVGGAPAAPAGSASTHLLRIDADTPDNAGDYAGAQVEVAIPWGHRHRASINVYSTTAQTIRFVIRTQTEGLIVFDEQALSAATWTLMNIPEFTLNEGVDIIVYRVGIIASGDASIVYLDVNEAVLAPGTAAANLGEIASDLLVPITARSVLDWIVETWDGTNDSSVTAWDQDLSQGLRKGQSLMQFLEYESRWGYERAWVYNGGTVTPFDLDLFNPGGRDSAPTGASVSAIDGMVAASPVEEAAPGFTTAIAEGADGRWGEFTDADLATAWGKLEGYFANKQGRDSTNLDALAEQMVADSATETVSHSATVQNPTYLYGDDFILGDTIPVALHAADGSITPTRLRLVACVITETETLPTYQYSFGAVVFDAEAAQADAVRTLIRGYRALDETGGDSGVVDPSPGVRGPGVGTPQKGGELTVTVAAVGSSRRSQEKADFVCTAGIDDRITIEDACISIGWNGKVVLSESTFIFDSGLLRSAGGGNVTFEGQGQNETIITSGTTMAHLFRGESTIDWSWKDLTLDGNNVVANSLTWGVADAGSYRMTRVTVRDFTADGVSLDRPAGDGRFVDCHFDSNTGRGFFQREAGCHFYFCRFTNNGGDGLRSDQSDNLQILGNLFENNGGSGFVTGNAVSGGGNNFRLVANVFRNNSVWGINLAHHGIGGESQIQSNWFSGNTSGSMGFGAGGFGDSADNWINGNFSTDGTFIGGPDAALQNVGINSIGGVVEVGDGPGIPGIDSTAIHDNIAAEISAIAEKVTPIAADKLVAEDSAAGDAKVMIQIGNLPGVIHDILSADHLDADETDTPTNTEVLTWNDPTMTVPTVRGVGASSEGATPGLPSGTAVGDLLVCAIESHPSGAVTASGWTVAPESPVQNGDGNTRLTILYRVATGTGDAPTLGGWSDHIISQIIGITTGTYDSADPFGVTTQSAHAGADSSTTLTFPGLTTLYKNSLILGFCAAHEDGSASAFVNASLTSLTEQIDAFTLNGNDGGIIGFSGTMPTIGATGDTTATYTVTVRQARIVFAISPLNPVVPAWRAVAAPAGGTALTTKGDLHGYDTGQARIPVGTNDQVLTADSGEGLGLKWADPTGGGGAAGEGNPSHLAGFGEDNLAASLTNSQLYRNVQGIEAQIPLVMSHEGAIVGLAVASSEARTAGTATFEVYKNGAATGLTAVLDATDTQYASSTQAASLDTFVAGDRLDVRVTTDGSWAPTTADVEAVVSVSQVEDWTSYTPTWQGDTSNAAIGNGTMVAKYRRTGTSVEINIAIITGSTTTYGSGDWSFTLPSGLGVASGFEAAGSCWGDDPGTSWRTGTAQIDASSTKVGVYIVNAAGASGRWNSAVPQTWVSGDSFALSITYETDFS